MSAGLLQRHRRQRWLQLRRRRSFGLRGVIFALALTLHGDLGDVAAEFALLGNVALGPVVKPGEDGSHDVAGQATGTLEFFGEQALVDALLEASGDVTQHHAADEDRERDRAGADRFDADIGELRFAVLPEGEGIRVAAPDVRM